MTKKSEKMDLLNKKVKVNEADFKRLETYKAAGDIRIFCHAATSHVSLTGEDQDLIIELLSNILKHHKEALEKESKELK